MRRLSGKEVRRTTENDLPLKMLIGEFLPNYDIRERRRIEVHAPNARNSPITRQLMLCLEAVSYVEISAMFNA